MIASPAVTPVAPFTRSLGNLVDADRAVVGSKAATLGRLRAAGFAVPDGFVLAGCSVSDLDGSGIRNLVESSLAEIGEGPFAVRSSSAAEDLEGASYAGQYDSVLGVDGLEEVLSAIRDVIESGRSRRVDGYRSGR